VETSFVSAAVKTRDGVAMSPGRSVMFARLIERVEIHLNKLAPENN